MTIEVVIPAHDAAAWLRATLDSIAAQTRPPALVTVVDDRSRDITAAVAEAAARELAPRLRIRLLRNAGPPGPSAARNTAIRASQAEWIALCDADDLMEPHHLATLAQIAAAPGTVLAFGDCCLFDSDSGRVTVESHHVKSRLLELASEPVPGGGRRLCGSSFAALLRGPRIPTSACLLKREAVIAAGLFDEAMRFAEDYDLFLRLARLGPMVFTPRRVARKRIHAQNLSQPENRARFSRANLFTLVKLTGQQASPGTPGLPLAPPDAQLCADLANRFVGDALYDSSREGIAGYLEAMRLARRAGRGLAGFHPRHLMRLALHATGILARAAPPPGKTGAAGDLQGMFAANEAERR